MISIGKVQKVAQKLVKSFGKGTKLRHVITETRNGVTKTQVLDFEGKLITERTKSFSRSIVGDKHVVTRKLGGIQEQTIDRVYNSQGKYLGQRITTDLFNNEKQVVKLNKKGEGFCKEFKNGICRKKGIFGDAWENTLGYNNLGLPIPEELFISGKGYETTIEACKGMSLQDMLRQVSRRSRFYPEQYGLDEVKITSKFNPLEYASKLNLFG